jgi:hypothetical protein
MPNLPIPAPAMPPPVYVAPITLDTVPDSGPDSEAFSTVLARELAAEKSETKPDTARSGAASGDGQPQPPGSEIIPLQVPPEASLAAPRLMALTPGVQPDQHASGDQPAIPVTTAGPNTAGLSTSDLVSGDRPTNSLTTAGSNTAGLSTSDRASGDQPTFEIPGPYWVGVAASDRAYSDQPAIPSQPVGQYPAGLSRSDAVFGSSPIRAKTLPGAASTETSAQRDFPQSALAGRSASAAADTADFAAPGKILSPVAAEEKTSRFGMEAQAPHRLSETAPLLQMTSLAIATAASQASASAPTAQNLQIDTRVGAPGWNGELAQKVVWMATQQHQVAELRLNPPHLGPVEVMLTVGNDQGAQASIQFASPHLATREALESALPRLREMMADSGIALGNVTVSADSFRQPAEARHQDRPATKQPADIGTTAIGLAGRSAATLIRSGHNGLVDTFA